MKRKRQKFSDVNELLLEWFKSARSKNIHISGPLMKEKALEIAAQIGISDFNASNGWLDRFRVRNNIVFRSTSGEAGYVSDVTCKDWIDRLPSIIEGYDMKDIYNMDETGLFFRALPSKSLMLKSKQCAGGKISKERLTVSFCVNGVGEKESPLVIGKSLRPRCFKNTDFTKMNGFTWRTNKKAWMTGPIFEEWILNFD